MGEANDGKNNYFFRSTYKCNLETMLAFYSCDLENANFYHHSSATWLLISAILLLLLLLYLLLCVKNYVKNIIEIFQSY